MVIDGGGTNGLLDGLDGWTVRGLDVVSKVSGESGGHGDLQYPLRMCLKKID